MTKWIVIYKWRDEDFAHVDPDFHRWNSLRDAQRAADQELIRRMEPEDRDWMAEDRWLDVDGYSWIKDFGNYESEEYIRIQRVEVSE